MTCSFSCMHVLYKACTSTLRYYVITYVITCIIHNGVEYAINLVDL